MKKLTMTVAVFLTVLGTAFASSGDGIEKVRANIVAGQNDTYRIFYTNKEESKVWIRFRDENGKLIQKDLVKNKDGFMKPYDLSKLEDGTYQVEITDQYGVITKEIELASQNQKKMAVKSLEDDRFQLIVEVDKEMPLLLTIYNAKNEVIHKERYNDMKGFTRVYDLSKFESSNFTFELSDYQSTNTVSVR